MNNVSIITSKNCFGCRSCESSCPKNSIHLETDEEGFLYPNINDSCIDCGICQKKCPAIIYYNNDKKEVAEPRACYGLVLKDKEILSNSASGGAFAGFAMTVLRNGGSVFGSAFDSDFNVRQTEVESENMLHILQGSKYVASDTLDTYKKTKLLLDKDKTILYSGTPCQIAGLKSFLGKDYKNLLTIDLICHGTPSHKFFKFYLDWLKTKLGGKIEYYSFRSKKISGWSVSGFAKNENKIKRLDCNVDPYYSAFGKNENYKEACYSCPFVNSSRIGDITIGDFWGVEKYFPEIKKSEGVSCCIVNTEKGERLFNQAAELFHVYPTQIDYIRNNNAQLIHPTKRPVSRDYFYENVYKNGIDSIKVTTRSKEKLIIFFWSLFPRKLKDFVKKVLRRD